MSESNSLNIKTYSSGITPIIGADALLNKAQDIRFSTGYPGGLYLDASFFIPLIDPTIKLPFKQGQRIVIFNAMAFVYEGMITTIKPVFEAETSGIIVECTGYWGELLDSRRMRKYWADTRTDEDIWISATADTWRKKAICDVDQSEGIKFIPRPVAWSTGRVVAKQYTAPAGENIQRVTFDYSFSESSQDWTTDLWDGSTSLWAATADSTGSADIDVASKSTIWLRLINDHGSAQTPLDDESIYANFTNVTVYSSTAAINATKIATDIVTKITDLNADTTLIASNTYALIPFISDWMTIAEILVEACRYGDSSQNAWAAGVRCSELAATADGKEVLFLEQVPALTDYEYLAHFQDPNLVVPLEIDDTIDEVWNWIISQYQNINGSTVFVTPDSDTGLADADSIASYKQKDYLITLGEADSTTAVNWGKRFLADHKDKAWRVTSPIQVVDYILDKSLNHLPSSEIEAGKRIKISNYIQETIMLITRTEYDDTTGICTIETGNLDAFDIFQAQLERLKPGDVPISHSP